MKMIGHYQAMTMPYGFAKDKILNRLGNYDWHEFRKCTGRVIG
jgi:hypothetical protein